MKMLRANFETALRLAIEVQENRDNLSGINSAFAAGLRDVLAAVQRGETIIIIED